jgi:hypothetical protein
MHRKDENHDMAMQGDPNTATLPGNYRRLD